MKWYKQVCLKMVDLPIWPQAMAVGSNHKIWRRETDAKWEFHIDFNCSKIEKNQLLRGILEGSNWRNI